MWYNDENSTYKHAGERLKTLCYIAGAGEFSGRKLPSPDDYIIAADAGYAQLISRGITPDLVVGDFDSLTVMPEHPNIISSPSEKDDTDMMLAVRQGLSRGYKSFLIDGGLGGRLDQSIANIQILSYLAQNGAGGILLGRGVCVAAVMDGCVSFRAGTSGTISVFCAGDKAEGVTLTGLKYPLRDAELTGSYPLGVSNEFTGAPASVSVRAGILLITWTDEPECLGAYGQISTTTSTKTIVPSSP